MSIIKKIIESIKITLDNTDNNFKFKISLV